MRARRFTLVLAGFATLWCAPAMAGDEAAVPVPAQEQMPLADLLREVPLIDGHNDLIIHFVDFETGEIKSPDTYDIRTVTSGQSDIPRMRQGMVGGAIFTIATNDDNAPEPGLEASVRLFRELVARSPDDLAIVTTPDELVAAHKAGKIGIMMGLEGGNPVEGDIGRLAWMKQRGVAEMGLVWSTNGLGTSGRTVEREAGLTELGEQVVREMNRVGLLIDVSHASAATVEDVVRITSAPIIDTHSYSGAFMGEGKDLTDEWMRAIASTGGLVMPMFMPDTTDTGYFAWMRRRNAAGAEVASRLFGRQVSESEVHYSPWPPELAVEVEAWIAANPPPPIDIGGIADVYDHVRGLVGIDHIGIGSDFDGMGFHPSGWHPELRDVSQLPALLEELRRRGWSDADLRKLAGENFLRVWREVLAAAEE